MGARRLRRLKSVGLSVLLVLGCCLARADEIQWYTVEIIVFKVLDESGLYLEHWPLDPGLPAVDATRSLDGADSMSSLQTTYSLEAAGSQPTEGFVLLPPDQFELGEVARAIERSNTFRPLLHIAWRQPGLAQADAVTVHVHSQLENPYKTDETSILRSQRQPQTFDSFALEPMPVQSVPSAVLDGTVRLRRARYLHIDADLVYFRPARLAQVVGSEPQPNLFRLAESRRMRSSELHFLDHPMFGVLVEVRPYERAGSNVPSEGSATTSDAALSE